MLKFGYNIEFLLASGNGFSLLSEKVSPNLFSYFLDLAFERFEPSRKALGKNLVFDFEFVSHLFDVDKHEEAFVVVLRTFRTDDFEIAFEFFNAFMQLADPILLITLVMAIAGKQLINSPHRIANTQIRTIHRLADSRE